MLQEIKPALFVMGYIKKKRKRHTLRLAMLDKWRDSLQGTVFTNSTRAKVKHDFCLAQELTFNQL